MLEISADSFVPMNAEDREQEEDAEIRDQNGPVEERELMNARESVVEKPACPIRPGCRQKSWNQPTRCHKEPSRLDIRSRKSYVNRFLDLAPCGNAQNPERTP